MVEKLLRSVRADRTLQGVALPAVGALLGCTGAALQAAWQMQAQGWDVTTAVVSIYLLSAFASLAVSGAIPDHESTYIRLSGPVIVALNNVLSAGVSTRTTLYTLALGSAMCATHLAVTGARWAGWLPDDPFSTRALEKLERSVEAGDVSMKDYASIHIAWCPAGPGDKDFWATVARDLNDPGRFENTFIGILSIGEETLGLPAHSLARTMHQRDLDRDSRTFGCPVDHLKDVDLPVSHIAELADRAPHGTLETLWQYLLGDAGQPLSEGVLRMNGKLQDPAWRDTMQTIAGAWKGDGTLLVRTVDLLSSSA